MTLPTRQELIELGVSLPEEALLDWVKEQLDSAKGREERLESRGLTREHLARARELLESIEHRVLESTGNAAPSSPVEERTLRLEARRWWKEAQDVARAGFGSRPDDLAEFRRGVLTGLLIANLTRELEIVLGLLRRHAEVLRPLGGDEAFLNRGADLIARLKKAATAIETSSAALPVSAAQLCHDKGLLYDLTRKLVRIGRLAFGSDPEDLTAFGFGEMNRARDLAAGSGRS